MIGETQKIKMILLTCKHCNKEFTPKNRKYTQECCSKRCAFFLALKRGKRKQTFKKGYKITDKHRKNLSISRKGKSHSEETKRKIGIANSISQKGKICSIETRKKMSEAHKGDKCHLWKGGITKINKEIRQSFEYKLWRISVFKRDNFKCIWCGNNREIQADHIKPFSLYPELRFAIDNGRTLCLPCHKKTDTYAKRIK